MLLIVCVATYTYRCMRQNYLYWTNQGIPGPTPIPFFGNFLDDYFTQHHLLLIKWYNNYGTIYGTYNGKMPVLHVADPELIKAIMVKDFHLFVNRHKLMKAGNSVTKHNLNHLIGEEWKRAGQQVEIPIYAIHHSEQYYPDPFKFKPDRFMPENKHLIKPYTYLPFGSIVWFGARKQTFPSGISDSYTKPSPKDFALQLSRDLKQIFKY
ncbi:unnamed protein product [Oppiella nova]|uniref:Cytochrome P450 n=1 Tax=Oppiella nova TaxID=334625 RepID=A0A7R9MDC7_9ACAR|nr:unnamed protein product [Oppiella nova]CAG2175110.1 unnamed protein product [Oppiella nova]